MFSVFLNLTHHYLGSFYATELKTLLNLPDLLDSTNQKETGNEPEK